MPIKLFIADDHAIFRSGLKSFLEKEVDLAIVGEAGDGQATLRGLREQAVDTLILDINMEGPQVGDVIAAARELQPNLAIVILTMHEDEFYLREVFRAGARAFVLKKSTGRELIDAIRAANQGGTYVDPALSHLLVSAYFEPTPAKRKGEGGSTLTRREKEVLQLLGHGFTNDEVGAKLFISKRTVETHRANIKQKLGLKTRAELVRYALAKDFIKPA